MTNTPSIVRVAGPADHREIWRLFLMGHRENGIFTLAPEKVDYFLQRTLYPEGIPEGDTGPRGVIGVIGPVGSLEGLVFLTIATYWYSHDKHLEDFLVYVDPEYRKSHHAESLIKWMKSQVEATRIPLMVGIVSNHKTEAKCRLYRRMLPKIGELFLLAPKDGNMSLGSVTASS